MTTTKQHPRQAQIDNAKGRGYDRAAAAEHMVGRALTAESVAQELYPDATDEILRDAFVQGWKQWQRAPFVASSK